MKKLEEYLIPTQKELFSLLCEKFKGKAIFSKGKFILVKGTAPVMLVAHLDTVHTEKVKTICSSADGNILMSPEGIGGDDRCGVYALAKVYEVSKVKPYLLFTCDEEIGGVGADFFCLAHSQKKLPAEIDKLKLIVEIDRRGSQDAVYYDCDNKQFENYITSKGFVTAQGSFSDISYIAPELETAAVNLSSGYYNAHTQHEFINCSELETVIEKVVEIVADSVGENFPKFKYEEAIYNLTRFSIDTSEEIPLDLPKELEEIYLDLVQIFPAEELEEYRGLFGDKILKQIHEENFQWEYFDDEEE